MPTIPMVVAVRRDAIGNVIAVQRGLMDSERKEWIPGSEPGEVPVLDIVDALLAEEEVWTQLPSGGRGPKLLVTLATGGNGQETIALQHPSLTVGDLTQF